MTCDRIESGRVMALDVGERRIGIAVSDPLGITAQPLQTLERAGARATVARILEIARAHGVMEIVVGIPYTARGDLTAGGREIERFAQALERAGRVKVVRWDERHTTAAAERVLLEADLSRERRRQVRDKMAAAVLLRDYLEAKARGDEAQD